MENFKTTYHTFKARDKNSYSIVEYRIQDLPEEYFECTLDLFVRDYITEETLYKSKKLWQNEASIKAIRAIYGETLQNHLAIGCFKNDGSDDLVGVNLLTVRTKNESKRNYFAYGDQGAGEVSQGYVIASSHFDVFKHYQVDSYMSADGLCVNADYTGRGVATELLRARVPILKALGLSVTASSFSTMGSQTAAKKAGYEDLFEISYDDLHKLLPHFDFSSSNTKCFKLSALKI